MNFNYDTSKPHRFNTVTGEVELATDYDAGDPGLGSSERISDSFPNSTHSQNLEQQNHEKRKVKKKRNWSYIAQLFGASKVEEREQRTRRREQQRPQRMTPRRR